MSSTDLKPSGSDATEAKAVVVFGLDEHDKPRAAWFTDAKLELVSKAAQLMELKLCEAAPPELAELAKRLPVGRLYANGRGFIPNVRRDLYAKLLAVIGDASAADKPASTQIAQGLPRTWDEIAIGHLVLAQASLEYGWWESIVIDRVADMLTLRWRDYPKEQKFSRHCDAVALMRPPAVEPASA
jgi:hypothetical protein